VENNKALKVLATKPATDLLLSFKMAQIRVKSGFL